MNTILTPQETQIMQHGSTVQVDPNTIQGQNQPITFHLQPVGGVNQGGQINTWNNQNAQMQNILEPTMTPADQKPYIKILEQPASHKLRFRYQCEGRGAGALQGQTSTAERKTFPKIQILGYKGPAVVVVSCVTHDSDLPKPHPHNLVSPASVSRLIDY